MSFSHTGDHLVVTVAGVQSSHADMAAALSAAETIVGTPADPPVTQAWVIQATKVTEDE